VFHKDPAAFVSQAQIGFPMGVAHASIATLYPRQRLDRADAPMLANQIDDAPPAIPRLDVFET
jgi:hypothetical protein